MPAINLTDELAAVTAALRRLLEGRRRFPHAPRLDPLRAALGSSRPPTSRPRSERPRRRPRPTRGRGPPRPKKPKISPASSWAGCRPTADRPWSP